jgi:hypothetical protein
VTDDSTHRTARIESRRETPGPGCVSEGVHVGGGVLCVGGGPDARKSDWRIRPVTRISLADPSAPVPVVEATEESVGGSAFTRVAGCDDGLRHGAALVRGGESGE